MEGTSADVQLLLASAHQEIATLKNDRRLKSSFVGDRGAALRQHVLDLIGASEYRLKLAPDDEAPDWSKQSFSRLLRDVMLNLRAAHAAMPWLAATQAPNINLGSLYLIEDFALALVQTKVDLVTVPDVEFMYSTESWPFWKLISETPDFTPKADRSPIVLCKFAEPVRSPGDGWAQRPRSEPVGRAQGALGAVSSGTLARVWMAAG